MNKMSDEARRMTFELNGSYHDPEEIRELLSRLFNKPVDPSFRVFPPFYTDFEEYHGRTRTFHQRLLSFSRSWRVTLDDGCQIGHNVVFATLNHASPPNDRSTTYPAPIVLKKNVWVARTQRSYPA